MMIIVYLITKQKRCTFDWKHKQSVRNFSIFRVKIIIKNAKKMTDLW